LPKTAANTSQSAEAAQKELPHGGKNDGYGFSNMGQPELRILNFRFTKK